MKTLLVVASDATSRRHLVSGLSGLKDECHVLEAGNGVEAMRILSSRPVDVVATELDMPAMDGFELSAYILEHHPSVEIVVLGSKNSRRVGQALTAGGAFRYLPTPRAAEALVGIVREMSSTSTRGPIEGLSLAGFLQLLNSENRTCAVEVAAEHGRGWVELIDGEVFDAVLGTLRGRRALYALLALENPRLDVARPRPGIQRTINAALPRLLLEAAFWQDEFTDRAPSAPVAPRSGAEFVQVVSEEAPAEAPCAPAELVEIKRGLLALLGLDGAIGAAVVDMDRDRCLLHVSLDPRFAETAIRAGRMAKKRLAGMVDGSRFPVLQIKLPSPDRFGLLRLVQAMPNLVLYFAGEMGQTDPVKAGALLAEIERLLAARFGAPSIP